MVVIFASKVTPQKWEGVTAEEKKAKDAKKKDSKTDKSGSDDPEAGLMNIMKKMYDDGDDETKRVRSTTIFAYFVLFYLIKKFNL